MVHLPCYKCHPCYQPDQHQTFLLARSTSCRWRVLVWSENVGPQPVVVEPLCKPCSSIFTNKLSLTSAWQALSRDIFDQFLLPHQAWISSALFIPGAFVGANAWEMNPCFICSYCCWAQNLALLVSSLCAFLFGKSLKWNLQELICFFGVKSKYIHNYSKVGAFHIRAPTGLIETVIVAIGCCGDGLVKHFPK